MYVRGASLDFQGVGSFVREDFFFFFLSLNRGGFLFCHLCEGDFFSENFKKFSPGDKGEFLFFAP